MSTLTFSLIQTDLFWEDKKANLKMLEQKIRSINEKTEVIVLPEMFSTGFSMEPERLSETMDGETVKWMQRLATEKKVIITGSFIVKEKGKGAIENKPAYYNRLLWVLPNGTFGVYDKRHRFAYADEDKYYEAGNKRLIASVKGWKINLLICYDLRFPVWARQNTDPEKGTLEFDVLIYVANWPEKRIEAWKTLLKARAIENQCYVIGVNRVGKDGKEIVYTGESMVVGPLGDTLYYKKDDEDVHTITLEKEHLEEVRKRFPFWKDADGFQLVP